MNAPKSYYQKVTLASRLTAPVFFMMLTCSMEAGAAPTDVAPPSVGAKNSLAAAKFQDNHDTQKPALDAKPQGDAKPEGSAEPERNAKPDGNAKSETVSGSEPAKVTGKSEPSNAKTNQDSEQPVSAPTIKGFHPIKKAMLPVVNLEGMSIKLEQQVMKLEAPISAIQPPMLTLQKDATAVDLQIRKMGKQLDRMQSKVEGVRSDLGDMRKEIAGLKEPINSLQDPITSVSTPLDQVNQKLTYVLISVFLAGLAIAVGTPLMAIFLYRNRTKYFGDAAPNAGSDTAEHAQAAAVEATQNSHQ